MKIFFLLVISIFVVITAKAQFQYGLQNDNYAGMNAVYLNPALMVDAPHRLNINIIGVNANVGNNYFKFPKIDDVINKDNKLAFKNAEIINGGNYLGVKAEVRLPSLTYQINNKNSLAVGVRSRTFANFDNMSTDVLKLLQKVNNYDDVLGNRYQGQNLDVNINSFAEISGTYARNIFRTDKHSLDFGFTVKYLSSQISSRVYAKDADIEILRSTKVTGGSTEVKDFFNIRSMSGEIMYSQSSIEDFNIETIKSDPIGNGKGFDFGLNYTMYRGGSSEGVEHETEAEEKKFKKKAKGRVRPYIFKAGMSITDIGSIMIDNPKVRYFSFQNLPASVEKDNINFKKPGSLATSIGIDTTNFETSFVAHLPTTFNFNFDYSFNSKLYASINWIQSTRSKNVGGIKRASYLAITPRLELRHIGVALPISFAQNYKTQQVGLAFRLAVLTIGTNNIAPLLGQEFTGADFFFGLNIPILRKKED